VSNPFDSPAFEAPAVTPAEIMEPVLEPTPAEAISPAD